MAESTRAESLEETEADGQGETAAIATGLPEVSPAPAGPRRRQRKKYGVAFWLAVAWLLLVLFGAITASWIPIKDPLEPDFSTRLAAPGEGGYLLGTDGLGRDVLSRLIHGSRVSIIISFATVAIGMSVGGLLGLVVGYFRGWTERIIMAIVDVILAFPGLILLLGLIAIMTSHEDLREFGRLPIIAGVIGFLSIPRYARVARANTLAVAQREFVLAAQAMGAKTSRVLFRELMPNVILPVAAFALVAIALVIILEGALAFLGLSVEQPTPTWGSMISEGKRHLRNAPYVAAVPSMVMFLTVLSLNFVGDSLRSLFDVRESGL